MRIWLVFDRTQISENENTQTETTPFGFGSFDTQPKSPIAVRPASPFFGIYRSSLPFIKQLIWVHMDQTAFEVLSTADGPLPRSFTRAVLSESSSNWRLPMRIARCVPSTAFFADFIRCHLYAHISQIVLRLARPTPASAPRAPPSTKRYSFSVWGEPASRADQSHTPSTVRLMARRSFGSHGWPGPLGS